MVDFTRDIGGAPSGFQTITPMTKPDGRNFQKALVGNMAVKFSQGVAGGLMTGEMEAKRTEALGDNLSNEQVNANVQRVTERMNSGSIDLGEMNEEDIRDYGTQVVNEVGVSARGVERLIKSNQIGSLEGEAYLRKKLGSIQANPVLAAFAGQAANAAGPRAGTGSGATGKLGGEAALLRVEAQAEGARKAVQEVEQALVTMEQKGVPRAIGQAHMAHQQSVQIAEENLQARQALGEINYQDQANLATQQDYATLNDLVAANLNEEGRLPLHAVQGITQQQSAQYQTRIQEIEASGMTRQAKDAEITALGKRHEQNAAYVKQRSSNTYNEEYASAMKHKNAKEVYEIAPILAWARDNEFQELGKYMTNMNLTEKAAALDLRFGDGKSTSILELGEDVGRFYDINDVRPVTAAGTQALAGSEATASMEKNEEDTAWQQQLAQAAQDHPGPMLYAINGSDLERDARGGNEVARNTMVGTFEAVTRQVQGSLAISSGKIGVSPVVRRGRVMPGNHKIDMPDGMAHKGEQLGEMLRFVQNNRWSWPEGAVSAADAFTSVVNGEAQLRMDGDAEDTRTARAKNIESSGRSAAVARNAKEAADKRATALANSSYKAHDMRMSSNLFPTREQRAAKQNAEDTALAAVAEAAPEVVKEAPKAAPAGFSVEAYVPTLPEADRPQATVDIQGMNGAGLEDGDYEYGGRTYTIVGGSVSDVR